MDKYRKFRFSIIKYKLTQKCFEFFTKFNSFQIVNYKIVSL